METENGNDSLDHTANFAMTNSSLNNYEISDSYNLDNLDEAESRLVQVLDRTISLVQHVKNEGLVLHGNGLVIGKIDKDKLVEDGLEMMNDLQHIQSCIANEIPRLVKYIPFERTSYGMRKDADIMKQKLTFAKDFIKQTLDDV